MKNMTRYIKAIEIINENPDWIEISKKTFDILMFHRNDIYSFIYNGTLVDGEDVRDLLFSIEKADNIYFNILDNNLKILSPFSGDVLNIEKK
jgi:hypothetical protein